jgi:hypothetical protein
VLRKTASLLVSLMLLGGASMLSSRAACAGDVVSMAPASRGPQIMLYVSQPLWSRGSSAPRLYGLRIGQLRMPSTTSQLTAIAPVQRELIDLQIVPHSEMRIDFGRRLIWNITRGAFDPHSNQSVLAVAVPIKGIRRSDAANQQPWDPASPGVSTLTGNAIPRRQVDGESLAIINMVIPSHWTPNDGRAAWLQLRPTIQFAHTQTTEAAPLLRGADTH